MTLQVKGQSGYDIPNFATFTDNKDGTGILHLAPTDNDGGNYTITLTATDNGGGNESAIASTSTDCEHNILKLSRLNESYPGGHA